MPASTPRVTSTKTPQPKPYPHECSVPLHRLQGVGRATRREAAPAQRPKDRRFGGREGVAINPEQEADDVLPGVHSVAFNRLACRSTAK
jgi:hypothetical protein